MEALIHALLDCILEGKTIRWNGYAPRTVIDRMEKALVDGKIDGHFKEAV